MKNQEEEEEVFKDVPNYEGLYQVSNIGRVKSLSRVITKRNGVNSPVKGRFLKQGTGRDGYLLVILKNTGINKTFKIHQLVAICFLNHTPNGHKIIVDHKDNNRSNNNLSNLQLITQRENASKDQKGRASKYIGVDWKKDRRKWRASINIKGKQVHLGTFTTELEASKAYQIALNEVLKH